MINSFSGNKHTELVINNLFADEKCCSIKLNLVMNILYTTYIIMNINQKIQQIYTQ